MREYFDMNHKKHISILLVLFFLSTSIFSITEEQQKSVLDPENANEARLNRLQPPEKILEIVGISPGMIVAEIGAGRGRYVVQLAVRVGETGKIYAEDIDSSALAYLENRCQRWGLENVETIVGEVTDPKLPQGELDLIFIISSYHHFEDPVVLLQNARSALKPEGGWQL
ncbi:MAG: class I SAM-dependent methyltransferase [Candidatus Aminicenantaceae bacterium]